MFKTKTKTIIKNLFELKTYIDFIINNINNNTIESININSLFSFNEFISNTNNELNYNLYYNDLIFDIDNNFDFNIYLKNSISLLYLTVEDLNDFIENETIYIENDTLYIDNFEIELTF